VIASLVQLDTNFCLYRAGQQPIPKEPTPIWATPVLRSTAGRPAESPAIYKPTAPPVAAINTQRPIVKPPPPKPEVFAQHHSQMITKSPPSVEPKPEPDSEPKPAPVKAPTVSTKGYQSSSQKKPSIQLPKPPTAENIQRAARAISFSPARSDTAPRSKAEAVEKQPKPTTTNYNDEDSSVMTIDSQSSQTPGTC